MASATLTEILSTARQIVDADVSPYKGAAHIWRLAAEENYEGFDDLRVWAGLASEWQEHPQHRETLDANIRDEAQILLERRGGGHDPAMTS